MPSKKMKEKKEEKKTSKKRKQGAGAGAKDEDEADTKVQRNKKDRDAREERRAEARQKQLDKDRERERGAAEKKRDAACAKEREVRSLKIPDRNAPGFSKDAELVVYSFLGSWSISLVCKCSQLSDGEWKKLWTIPTYPSGTEGSEESSFLNDIIHTYSKGDAWQNMNLDLQTPVPRLIRCFDMQYVDDPFS